MARAVLAVVLVLFALRGVAAAHPPDPAADAEASSRVASLVDDTVAMSLPVRVERAFLLTLHAAAGAIRRGDVARAVTLLKTFAYEVRGARRAGRLPGEAGEALIARAEEAIGALSRQPWRGPRGNTVNRGRAPR